MRAAVENDISWILERYQHRADSSLVSLASIFGFSNTEWRSWIAESASLYIDRKQDGSLLFQVIDIDRHMDTARVALCTQGDYRWTIDLWCERLMGPPVSRMVCNVFAEEEAEIRLLNQAGFRREVIFREHVFVQGRYRDVLVYGRSEWRP